LIPAFAWAVLSRKELRRSPAILAGLAVLPLILFSARQYTLQDYGRAATGGFFAVAWHCLVSHVTEIGELAVNVPQRHLPIPVQLQILFLFVVGAMVAYTILTGMLQRLRPFGVIDIYFIAYAVIVFLWPYRDPRFWVPLLPFVMAYSRIGAAAWLRRRWSRRSIRLYKAAFAGLGVAALLVSSRLSLSGPDFPNRYASGPFRATYCAALNGCQGSYDANEVDPKVLHLLKTYK
jgi:hypothetical protein